MKKLSEIFIQEFNYDLPNEKIAVHPLPQRDSSKLLIYEDGKITLSIFKSLIDYLPPNSSLILNNTRVIEARIFFKKNTGGIIEIFCLEPENLHIEEALRTHKKVQWNCLIGGASKWRRGEVLEKLIDMGGVQILLNARYINKNEDSFIIEFSWHPSSYQFAEILHAVGLIPLPPYIKRKVEDSDAERYQTIFAKKQGSVASPTAALHFTESVFKNLKEKGISQSYLTLHVGAGTFKPVKAQTIADHVMHPEQFEVSLDTLKILAQTKEIIAVGTTSLRTLESLYWIGVKIINGLINEAAYLRLDQWEAYELENKNISYRESINAVLTFVHAKKIPVLLCHTSLIIVPGYKFYSAKALITNFHQPKSTLLLLVAAFIGDDWKKVYEYALENQYRFLSYGDSSLLWRKEI
jgi:S-adenosylmethionine:tRNA ribosyltransferase-isomerase